MKRLAILATDRSDLSPARLLADRFTNGYPWKGRWHKPETTVEFADTPRGADAALVFGPSLMAPCVQAFEAERRAIPIFHWGGPAREAVDASRRLGFPLLAGTALPVTWRLPDVQLPAGCVIEEAVAVGYGGRAFETVEALQAMVERRKGGETGVARVRRLRGAAVWDAGWSKALLSSALSRSDTPQGWTLKDGRTQDLVGNGELSRLVANPEAFLIDYRDGLKGAVLLLEGAVKDFTFAAKLRSPARVESTQFFMPPPPNCTWSACLAARIEDMLEIQRAPWPAERALLAGAIVENREADFGVRYRMGNSGKSEPRP